MKRKKKRRELTHEISYYPSPIEMGERYPNGRKWSPTKKTGIEKGEEKRKIGDHSSFSLSLTPVSFLT